jgi:hypothetical protein
MLLLTSCATNKPSNFPHVTRYIVHDGEVQAFTPGQLPEIYPASKVMGYSCYSPEDELRLELWIDKLRRGW